MIKKILKTACFFLFFGGIGAGVERYVDTLDKQIKPKPESAKQGVVLDISEWQPKRLPEIKYESPQFDFKPKPAYSWEIIRIHQRAKVISREYKVLWDTAVLLAKMEETRN